ncbi:MAG: hypothetical protein ABEJ70_01435 [Halobacteriaceae archaeon]
MTRAESLDCRRAQLVLLAAAVVATALLPATMAYLQLGYHGDVRAAREFEASTAPVRSRFARALPAAARDVPADYGWDARTEAVATVEARLAPTVRAVERGGRGARRVTYNRTAARAVTARGCPGGPDRQFGPCVAVGGVVVQRRSNRTHVVAAALDVRSRAPGRRRRVTLVVRR